MAKVSFSDRTDWFELWCEDKRNMISTMWGNLTADIKAGYNPAGLSITAQKMEITAYERDYMDRLIWLSNRPTEIDKWCFNDLLKRGAIA